VDNITTVINDYEERVRRMQVVPLFSNERRMLRPDGAPNRAFFYTLFNDHVNCPQHVLQINASPQSGMDPSH
jgi:hypothetical protein